MKLSEARKILGLGPDEDPRPHLVEFRSARERIAELVRSAPNETLGDRYQQGLVEFDKALAAVREYLEALGLVERTDPATHKSPPPKAEPAPKPKPSPAQKVEEEILLDLDDPPAVRRRTAPALVLLIFLLGVAGGGFLYYKNEEAKELRKQVRITLLERIGSDYIENRRWQDAARLFNEIELIDPDSNRALLGRRSIEAGMAEEQTQYVGYWTGQALAELESGRLDEAEAAARRIIERFPAEKEVHTILQRVNEARARQSHDALVRSAKELLNQRKWEPAITAAREILAKYADDADARAVIEEANIALAKFAADQSTARELFANAVERDQGKFDQQALELLREAASLDPENTEIAARLEQMASYTRTLRVPEEFATPAEALAIARDRDRVVLAENTWKGPLVINTAVELQGAGAEKTIVECPAGEGSAISIGPKALGARISGITFRHETFHAVGDTRFSAALVRGGATFVDCAFNDASGHGLAVIEGGEATATRCHFANNGWNGAAAFGKGVRLEVRESESINNIEHGIESWEGASVVLVKNRCEGNSRNGIHADNQTAAATIEGNQLIANREFGIVLDSAGSGKIQDNTARANLLGGIVIRTAAAEVTVTGNTATLNKGPGIVLEKGLSIYNYKDNITTRNEPRQILSDAVLSHQDPK